MLEQYYNSIDGRVSDENHKRIVAMKAALEFAKASASASNGNPGHLKVEYDLKNAAAEIANLANAIRNYMDA